jgi:hypothetical protein
MTCEAWSANSGYNLAASASTRRFSPRWISIDCMGLSLRSKVEDPGQTERLIPGKKFERSVAGDSQPLSPPQHTVIRSANSASAQR